MKNNPKTPSLAPLRTEIVLAKLLVKMMPHVEYTFKQNGQNFATHENGPRNKAVHH